MAFTAKLLLDKLRNYEFIIDPNKTNQDWFEHKDSFRILQELSSGVVPCLVTLPQGKIFIYSVLVSRKKIVEGVDEGILNWNSGCSHGYSYDSVRHEKRNSFRLADSDDYRLASSIRKAEPIIFRRETERYIRGMVKLEANQKICHRLNLVYLPEQEAWCKSDDEGDFQPILTIKDIDGIEYCVMERNDLEDYMALTDSVCITLFEFNKTTNPKGHINFSTLHVVRREDNIHRIFANLTVSPSDKMPTAAFIRGYMVTELRNPRRKYLNRLLGQEKREYESFIVTDFRSGKSFKLSTNPNSPYQIGPVFFKPEVLDKFKAAPQKYKIIDGCIYGPDLAIRYEENDDGFVVVVFEELRNLTEKCQKYWRAFNVYQKEPLSDKIKKIWYEGNWDSDYDPLWSLKEVLRELEESTSTGKVAPVWKMKQLPPSRDINFLNYVLTDSPKEWENQIIALEQIVVEGLNETYIVGLAELIGCRDAEKKFKSIKLVEEILRTRGINSSQIRKVVHPLFELRNLRDGISHPRKMQPEGDLRKQFRWMLKQLDDAMRTLYNFAQTDLLGFPN